MDNLGQVELTKKITVKKTSNRNTKKWIPYVFLAPWLIGFFGFYIGPMIASLYLSFTNYDLLSTPKWIGLDNYIKMFTQDSRFITSLKVTFKFVFISVPLKLIFALMLALIFNQKLRGSAMYRTIYYVPSIIGGSVAVAIIWRNLFSADGAINEILSFIGITGQSWISNPNTALSTLIILVVWQFGSPMLIFLAGLKQIPYELYEAAAVDGASKIRQFFSITIPMLSPIIFFNLIMQTINGFMAFTQSFLITKGGPIDSTLFYAVYLYERGFQYFEMGYASALAWILLLIVALFTVLIFKTSSKWVYYDDEGK